MIKLFAPLLCTTALFSYTIDFDKRFELSLTPDTLTTNVSITTHKKTEKEALEKLSSFAAFISGYLDVDKKGGNYTINPEYRYDNNHRYKDGYVGNMHYQISAKESDAVNTFISNLHDKKKDFDVDISLSSVAWQLSPAQKSGKLDTLRFNAIVWVNDYAKQLSKRLNSVCNVNKISFSSPSFQYPTPVMMEAKTMASDAAPTPEQDEQKISINPHFELECE